MLFRYFLIPALILALAGSSAALAKDFALAKLKQKEDPTFDLADVAGKKSYYDFMHATLGKKIQEESKHITRDNEGVLKEGGGVSVKLSENNYNIHINFPNGSLGGRSYGWTDGQVGDWSDRMYLDNLFDAMTEGSGKDFNNFYNLIIQMLGSCNSEDIENLSNPKQRVASNFLAIYTAEEYRAMVPDPHKNWDDALLETTLLAAFHAGQEKFKKFYLGKFSTKSKAQGSGVYARNRPGPNADEAKDKTAEMNDYWQFSANPSSKQSGINLTRFDFEKMGAAITKYESSVARNKNLAKIQDIVGEDENVIKAISKYFTEGNSKGQSKVDALAKAVAGFMADIHDDADKITAWIDKGGADE